jgi:uncharacterized protein (DUF736 family)
MATIGTFRKIGDDEYRGEILTLNLRANNIRIVGMSRTNDNAPSHRVYAGRIDYAE